MSLFIEYENIPIIIFRTLVTLLLLGLGVNGLQKRGYTRITRAFIIPTIAIFGYLIKQIGDSYIETCGDVISDNLGFTQGASDEFSQVGYDECFKTGVGLGLSVNLVVMMIFYGIYSVWFYNHLENLEKKAKEGSIEFKKE